MYACNAIEELLYPYLDGELDVKEVIRVQSHLKACRGCRGRYRLEKEFLDCFKESYHQVQPEIPSDIRHEILRTVASKASTSAAGGVFKNLGSVLAFAAVILLVVGFAFSFQPLKKDDVPELVRSAVNHHQGYVDGSVHLDFQAIEPQEATSWFKHKVGFPVQLPSALPENLSLEGGKIGPSETLQLALLAYDLEGQKVSLGVTASSYPKRSLEKGGIPFDGLIFYPKKYKGFHTISWNHDGLSYILVSSDPERVKQACVVCHGTPRGLKTVEGFIGKKI